MRFLPLAILPLVACSVMADTLNYAGTMRPVAGTCDPASEAVLTRRESAIIFAPAGGTLLLDGKLNGQQLVAILTLSDPNKQPYHLVFEGTLTGKSINGTYTTPRCRYAVSLHRTGD